MSPLETIPLDDLRQQLEVNLISQVAVTQAMLPLIRAARGRVVFISSIGGRMAMPFGAPTTPRSTGSRRWSTACARSCGLGRSTSSRSSRARSTPPIWERGEGNADEVAGRAPASQEELYGKKIESFRGAVRRTAERGIPPEKVAARSSTRSARGARALVTWSAPTLAVQALLSRLLPDRVMDRIVARAMGI